MWACRWAGTAAPSRCARLMVGPGRWSARTRPLSAAGSCRPSPDRQSEATSPDRGRRAMMPGDRFGSLLLQGCAPVLIAPLAGVGGIHPDHRDAAAGRHGDQPSPEPRGGDTSHGAAQSLSAFPAAQGFPAGGPRVGEVQILDHDRRALCCSAWSSSAVIAARTRPSRRDAASPAVTTSMLTGSPIGLPDASSTQQARCPSLRSTPSTRPGAAPRWQGPVRGWSSRRRPDTSARAQGRS